MTPPRALGHAAPRADLDEAQSRKKIHSTITARRWSPLQFSQSAVDADQALFPTGARNGIAAARRAEQVVTG